MRPTDLEIDMAIMHLLSGGDALARNKSAGVVLALKASAEAAEKREADLRSGLQEILDTTSRISLTHLIARAALEANPVEKSL